MKLQFLTHYRWMGTVSGKQPCHVPFCFVYKKGLSLTWEQLLISAQILSFKSWPQFWEAGLCCTIMKPHYWQKITGIFSFQTVFLQVTTCILKPAAHVKEGKMPSFLHQHTPLQMALVSASTTICMVELWALWMYLWSRQADRTGASGHCLVTKATRGLWLT